MLMMTRGSPFHIDEQQHTQFIGITNLCNKFVSRFTQISSIQILVKWQIMFEIALFVIISTDNINITNMYNCTHHTYIIHTENCIKFPVFRRTVQMINITCVIYLIDTSRPTHV